MGQCYLCGQEITKLNQSEEHILLNSIGGKLKSRKLLCKSCNSNFGDKIDDELSSQLNFISNMLDIKRDRGSAPKIEGISNATGEKWNMLSGGKPELNKPSIVVEECNDSQKNIQVIARSKREARQILQGLSKKYPEIDAESILSNIKIEKKYINDSIHMNTQLGGVKFCRAICKMAINYYMYIGGKRENISHLIPYIKGEMEDQVVCFFYNNDISIEKNENEVLHSIVVVGSKVEKSLYAYIELYNAVKLIVLLSDNYKGENLEKAYVYDVINGIEVNRHIRISLSKQKIVKLLESKEIPFPKLEEKLHELLMVIAEKQQNDHIHEMTTTAIENIQSRYCEEEVITSEMVNDLVDEVMKQVVPWIEHIHSNDN